MPNGVPQSPMWFSRMTSWPDELEQSHQAVADHRRAEVADVHLLRDVGRRVVDHRPLGLRGAPNAESLVGGGRQQLLAQELGSERQVDESRAGDLDMAAHRAQQARVDRSLGQLVRVGAHLLRQCERAVRLRIGSVARAHHRVDAVGGKARHGGECLAERGGDGVQRIGHGLPMVSVGPAGGAMCWPAASWSRRRRTSHRAASPAARR